MQVLAGENQIAKQPNLLQERAKKNPNTTAKKKGKKVFAPRADRRHSRFIVVKDCCCHDNLWSTSAYQVFAN